MAEQPGSARLDPETLAAYVDGRLPPDERTRVEVEIAADPEMYEWLVNSIRSAEAFETVGVPGVLVPSFGRRRWVVAAGAGLALAASLLLIVRLQPAWWQPDEAGEARLATLVAAVGEERYIEGRLTGGFKYGPLRPVTRGPGDLAKQNLGLLAAAAELQKAAQDEPAAEALQAWGAAQIFLGEFDGAVSTLQQAAAAAPRSARIQSDLAAAYIGRATHFGREDDWPLALAAAERGLELDAALATAAYNMALSLEGLIRLPQAEAAWRRALQLETDARWRGEIQRRVDRLASRPNAALLPARRPVRN